MALVFVLGLASAPSGVAQAPAPPEPPPSAAAPAASGDAPNPIASWKALLATAKAAEEGDGDLPAASDQYVSIVRIFDALRPVAAEALFRYAVVETRREHGDEAQAAHTRLIQWFPDFPDYVKQSLAIRGGPPAAQNVPTGAPDTGGDSPAGGASGEAPAAGLAPYAMHPELMRRYGLGPSKPGSDPGPRTTFSMSPALMARYGLVPAASASTSPEAKTDPADASRDRKLADLLRERSELAAETSRTASDLRKARLEKSRVGNEHPKNIPPNLVSDARLRALIEQYHEARATLSGDEGARLLQEQMNRLEDYHHNVYLQRLDRTLTILEREFDTLRVETQNLDQEVAKLSDETHRDRVSR